MTALRHMALIAAAATLSACASAGADMGPSSAGVDPVLGQTIIFVGTDSTTLRTNIYQVQAVSLLASLDEGGDDRAVLSADEFELTPLTDFTQDANSPVQSDGDALLPPAAPFALPDRLGARVAVLATGYDVDGVSVGRAAVLTLGTRELQLAPDVNGLRFVRFTWAGGHLLLEHDAPEDGRSRMSWLPFPLDPSQTPSPVEVAGATSIAYAGPLPGSEGFLATATLDGGLSSVIAVDPVSGDVRTVTTAVAGNLSDVSMAPGGALIAATLRDPESGRRDIVLAAWSEGAPNQTDWQKITDGVGSDCSDSAWAPGIGEPAEERLGFVCQNPATGRPDVFLWEGWAPPGSEGPSTQVLTEGAQTAVPDGSMDGLVVRSRLQWDPAGEIVVFGASSADDAFNSEAMTLLAVDVTDRRAQPIYDGDDGVADLAHFSSAAPDPVLLVWDRSGSGLEDTAGRHPIQLVAADPSGNRTVRGVSLGENLLVSYPLFLGGNSLFYP